MGKGGLMSYRNSIADGKWQPSRDRADAAEKFFALTGEIASAVLVMSRRQRCRRSSYAATIRTPATRSNPAKSSRIALGGRW